MAKQLIFVSGFGDSSSRYYHRLAPAWRSSGLSPHVFIFGWDDVSTDFANKFERLLAFLDKFPNSDELYLVGISAGGTAAVNALSARPRIVKIAVICSPLKPRENYRSQALRVAIADSQTNFARFGMSTKDKIVTFRGWRDGVVPPELTKLPGVRNVRVFGFGHAPNIVTATLIQKRRLLKALTT
jgi:pimeloyl-ACP methyl ester carboxylesterase